MEGLYLGIEICDAGCRIAVMDPQTKKVQTLMSEDQESLFPGYLCYDMMSDLWYAGGSALAHKGQDNCMILHRLFSLFQSGQSLTVNDTTYSGDRLLGIYLNQLISYCRSVYEQSRVLELTLCVASLQLQEADRLLTMMSTLGFRKNQIHILNRQECYMHYVMSMSRENWTNGCMLLDYDKNSLDFYEMTMHKGIQNPVAKTSGNTIHELPAFPEVDYASAPWNQLNEWFARFMQQSLKGKIINSIFLTGTGFSNLEWAKGFIQSIAQKSRRIIQMDSIYCMGAACASYHLMDASQRFPYTLLCEGRVFADLSLNIDDGDEKRQVILVPAGTNCWEARSHIELLLTDTRSLDLIVKSVGNPDERKISVDLSSFFSDNQDCIRIGLRVLFLSGEELLLQVKDNGFGDFFPATGEVLEKKYSI